MSKFAVLHVEGLSSSDDEDSTIPSKTKASNKKVPVPTVRKSVALQQPKKPQQKKQANQRSPASTQGDEWSRKDAQLTDAAYQRDLAEAILASKLESTTSATVQTVAAASASLTNLEENSRKAAAEAIKREKVSERDQIRREVELALEEKFRTQLDAKSVENAALHSEIGALNQQLADAQAETARLNSLITLVEGKKAKGLAEQIYQLTVVIQELTDHSKVLDCELAKEKTKSHQLQEQLDRLKLAR